jgi:hypothetical protein
VVDVVELRVVLVQPDQDVVREPLVEVLDARLDVLVRRQVAVGAGLEIDVVQPPVLVAAAVLDVEQVAVVVRPVEKADPAVAIVGDDAGVLSTAVTDPDVEDALVRGDPRETTSVRRDPRAEPLGIAEEDGARDERGDRVTLRGTRAERAEPPRFAVTPPRACSLRHICASGAGRSRSTMSSGSASGARSRPASST